MHSRFSAYLIMIQIKLSIDSIVMSLGKAKIVRYVIPKSIANIFCQVYQF